MILGSCTPTSSGYSVTRRPLTTGDLPSVGPSDDGEPAAIYFLRTFMVSFIYMIGTKQRNEAPDKLQLSALLNYSENALIDAVEERQ